MEGHANISKEVGPRAASADSAAAERAAIRKEIDALIARHFEHMPGVPEGECPLSVPLYGAEEVSAALVPLLEQRVTMGENVRAFEQMFADFMGSKYAIMVNSGSSANLLAIAALCEQSVPDGLRPGDEVIVPSVTWSTTVTPILQLGLVPVLVDIDAETLNMRPESVLEAIGPRTRAVMPVHLLGNPVDMSPLMEIAREHKLWVIEDTCESLGSEIAGKKVGSFGDFGTFSFYFSHHITTIEGGMIVTDDPHLNDLARSLRAHGWSRDMSNKAEIEAANPWIDPHFLFVNVGYNFRPMETQAAFGLVQLPRLAEFNERRRENAKVLADALKPYSDQLTFVSEQEGGRSTWFGFSVLTKDAETRRGLRDHLEARNIATRPIVAGNLALQPAFRDNPHRTVGTLANASSIGERGLFIGNHPSLTDAHLQHIVRAFEDFFS
ncbi:MAG TPA: DegT/DnrJ/EryC1/StrS family aminotransferase [Solirubrobacterales bacterium]|nr:DegT/DnrJ/EryC1/StrS family aminotransferase [Solirubrobacterales bacterium]